MTAGIETFLHQSIRLRLVECLNSSRDRLSCPVGLHGNLSAFGLVIILNRTDVVITHHIEKKLLKKRSGNGESETINFSY